MSTRILTLDIETKAMVANWDTPWDAGISCVGVDASWHPAPMVFDEHNLDKLPRLVGHADTLVTYNGTRFDLPILEHFVGPLQVEHHYDLMLVIKAALGRRCKLEHVARATLGVGKGGHGAMAPDLYQQGLFAQLHSYCLRDVAITRRVYDFIQQHGFVLVWNEDQQCNQLVEIHSVGRRPAKGRVKTVWDRAMGVG